MTDSIPTQINVYIYINKSLRINSICNADDLSTDKLLCSLFVVVSRKNNLMSS